MSGPPSGGSRRSNFEFAENLLKEVNMSQYTLSVLLDLTYRAEKATEQFYMALTDMFLHEPTAASVWWEMATEEGFHIWLVEKAREVLTPEQLETPVESKIIERVRQLAEFYPETMLARIRNLEDAYQAAELVEAVEAVNLLTPIMVQLFPTDIRTKLIRSQLERHLEPLKRLGDKEWRRTVEARRPSAAAESSKAGGSS